MVNGPQYFYLSGRKIAYEIFGNGPCRVLFLPGALGSYKTDFQAQLNSFDLNKFTLIGWDPPGYGCSRPPDRDFSGHFFRRDANSAHELMKKLSFENSYSTIGWSDGAITALIMAAEFPESVRKTIAIAGSAYVTKKDVEICEELSDLSKWSAKMRQPFLDMYGENYYRSTWRAWIDAYTRFYTDFNGDICKNSLSTIRCPTLIVHGLKDPVVPEEHCHFLHKNIVGSRLVTMPDGKHNLQMKYADQFNRLAQEFLLQASSSRL